jgi:hypothetical protein
VCLPQPSDDFILRYNGLRGMVVAVAGVDPDESSPDQNFDFLTRTIFGVGYDAFE